MTTENKWTKFSERLPDSETTDVYVVRDAGQTPSVAKKPPYRTWLDWSHYYAWHPITYPEPPKEETQLDKDNYAMLNAWRSLGIDFAHCGFGDIQYSYQEGWKMALAYERAEVAKIISNSVRIEFTNGKNGVDAINALRRRCGLDK